MAQRSVKREITLGKFPFLETAGLHDLQIQIGKEWIIKKAQVGLMSGTKVHTTY